MMMTIHSALAELKTIDARIARASSVGKVDVNSALAPKVNGVTVEKYSAEAKAAWDSVKALLKRRAAIKNAVAESNAKTTVVVKGETMTVAAAIEMRKTGVSVYRDVMSTLALQYEAAERAARVSNSRLDEKADKYITTLFGAKERSTSADALTMREKYINENTVNIVDPIDAKARLEELHAYVDTLDAELDAALSVSNAITTIEIAD